MCPDLSFSGDQDLNLRREGTGGGLAPALCAVLLHQFRVSICIVTILPDSAVTVTLLQLGSHGHSAGHTAGSPAFVGSESKTISWNHCQSPDSEKTPAWS